MYIWLLQRKQTSGPQTSQIKFQERLSSSRFMASKHSLSFIVCEAQKPRVCLSYASNTTDDQLIINRLPIHTTKKKDFAKNFVCLIFHA